MVRLRARGDQAGGFQSTWLIGGISTEIAYDTDCLDNPRAYVGSDAAKGGVTVGPPTPVPSYADREAVQIVLSHPRGFQLAAAGSVDPTRLGLGPILDIAFDRKDDNPTECSGTLGEYFWIHSLKVRDRDGTLRVSLPLPRQTFDASPFFYLHYVDPERPS